MGVYGKIRSEKWFEHFGGASLLVGNLSAFHQYGNLKGFRGSKNMLPIAQSFSMGLGLSYEARFVFSKYAALYLRPVIQYFLPSQIRNLNAYLNPFETEGELQYAPLDANKYNRGSLSGIGMEAGLLISLSNAKR